MTENQEPAEPEGTEESGIDFSAVPEPTDDDTPDGTQLPIEDSPEEPNQDEDAGVGGAEIEYDEDPFTEGD